MLRSNSGNFYIIIGNIPDSDLQPNSLGSKDCEAIVVVYVSESHCRTNKHINVFSHVQYSMVFLGNSEFIHTKSNKV